MGNAPLDGMRVVVLVAEGVEDLEYWVTVMRLREAGATVTSVGTTLDIVKGKNALEAKADFDATDVQRDAAEAKARAEDMQIASAALGGVALAALATGTVLWVTASADPAEGSAQLSLAGRF